MPTLSTRIFQTAPTSHTDSLLRLRQAATVFAGTLLLALCAHIELPLPFTPVPVTMQTFAVLLLGMALGPTIGSLSVLAYLLEGALGLPVFAPTPNTLLFFGPTAGYLLAFPVAALIAGLVYQTASRRFSSLSAAILAGLLASLPIFLIGATWLAAWLHLAVSSVYRVGVLPFVPGEAVKLLLAAIAAASLNRLRSAQ